MTYEDALAFLDTFTDVPLVPWQRDLAARMMAGEQFVFMRARRCGWATVLSLVERESAGAH